MSKRVADFSFEGLGVNSPSYFQGAGVAYTSWDAVFVGVGDTAREAAHDAIEQSCLTGDVLIELGDAATEFDDEASAHDDCTCECEPNDLNECLGDCHDECELQHHVALYVRYASARCKHPGCILLIDEETQGDLCADHFEFQQTSLTSDL